MRALWLHFIAASIIDALFPSKCVNCGELLADRHQNEAACACAWGGKSLRNTVLLFFCHECGRQLKQVSSPICSCCGEAFVSRRGRDRICGRCTNDPPAFDAARALFAYEEPLVSIIHRFKYSRATHLSRPLGKMLFAAYKSYFSGSGIDLIVPVPLHPNKLRERGFNQASRLACRWQRWTAKENNGNCGFHFDDSVLARKKDTRSQTGLSREDRQKNMRSAFTVTCGEAVFDKKILVVDDVMTTGATASACARELKKAGAKKVFILTLARRMKGGNGQGQPLRGRDQR